MFESYTDRARRAIFFSRYEAGELGSAAIEPEHILLGLIREDRALIQRLLGDPSRLFSLRGEIARQSVSLTKVAPSVNMPLAESSIQVLAAAAAEKDWLGHRHIGTEHLLLGILSEPNTVAARVLAQFGVASDQIRVILRGR